MVHRLLLWRHAHRDREIPLDAQHGLFGKHCLLNGLRTPLHYSGLNGNFSNISYSEQCLMFGPGRALRGDKLESVDLAVEQMKEKSYLCFVYFMLELFFFHISSFLLMWIYYKFLVALVVNIVLGLFLVMFFMSGKEVITQLYVSEEEAVTGMFDTFKDSHVKQIERSGLKSKTPAARGTGGNQPYARFMDEANLRS